MEDDDDTTEPGVGGDAAFAAVASALADAARAVRETAGVVAAVPPDHRQLVYRQLAIQLGELGDLAHDARRAVMHRAGLI